MTDKIIREIHLVIDNALHKQLRDIAKQYPEVIGYRPDDRITEEALARINFLTGLAVKKRWAAVEAAVVAALEDKSQNCINHQKTVSLKHGKINH